jgi:hypothetical protein
MPRKEACEPGTVLRSPHPLCHLFIPVTGGGKFYYYLHFTNKGMEAQRVRPDFEPNSRACVQGNNLMPGDSKVIDSKKASWTME